MEPEVHLAFIRGRVEYRQVKPKGVVGEEEEKLLFLISNSWSQFFEGVFSKYGGLLRIMAGCENQ